MVKHIDTLTELPNRTGLGPELDRLVAAGEPVALAVLDLDHFLEVNSEFGHDVGDQLLIGLAALLREALQQGVYRISGDEFAVVMPGLGLEQAFLRMESLRARVHSHSFGLPDGREVTVTIGVAQYPRDARDSQALRKAAGAALMAAKETGRNQVALPPNEEMVMKSCYYSAAAIRRLKALAEELRRKESVLLREALDDVLRKYDVPREG